MKPAKFISTAVLSAAAVSALGSVPAEAAITPNPDVLRTDQAHHSTRDMAPEIGRQVQKARQARQARQAQDAQKAAPEQAQSAQRPAAQSQAAKQQSQAQSPNANRQSRKARESGITSLNFNDQVRRAGQAEISRDDTAQQPTAPEQSRSGAQNPSQPTTAQRKAADRSRRLARMQGRLNKCMADALIRLNGANKNLRQADADGGAMFRHRPGTRSRVSTLPAVQRSGSARQSDDAARSCRMD